MNYELALKLKEAGFPQKRATVVFKDSYVDNEGNLITTPDEFAYPPELSELIEACGDKFDSLVKKNGGWQSSSVFFLVDGIAHNEEWIGSTPEEAVANLWLALNPKKDEESLPF